MKCDLKMFERIEYLADRVEKYKGKAMEGYWQQQLDKAITLDPTEITSSDTEADD